jgi:nitrogen fixation protein FixH
MKRLAVFLLLMVVLTVAGCGRPGGAAPPATVTRTAGSSATLWIAPNPPIPMQEVTLQLTLRDAQGRPMSGATVQLDLTMPGMQMPTNQPQVMEVGNGVYQARAIFTMAGEWQVRADVTHAGERQEFTFPLRTK